MSTFREISKQNYKTSGINPTFEEIKTGSIQRIADASELMARNYASLVAERDRYKSSEEWSREECRRLWRRINALRGVITKLKNRLP